jgi:hypothetical protein
VKRRHFLTALGAGVIAAAMPAFAANHATAIRTRDGLPDKFNESGRETVFAHHPKS